MLFKILRCCFFLFILGMVAAIDLTANELVKKDSLTKITSINNTPNKTSGFITTVSASNQIPFQPGKQNSTPEDNQLYPPETLESYSKDNKSTLISIDPPEVVLPIREDSLQSELGTQTTPSASDTISDFPKSFSQGNNQNEVDLFLQNLGRILVEDTGSNIEITAADYHRKAVADYPEKDKKEDVAISEPRENESFNQPVLFDPIPGFFSQFKQEGFISFFPESVLKKYPDNSCYDFENDVRNTGNLVNSEEKPIPDIPVYSNKRIRAFIHLYAVKKRDVFIKAIERSAVYMTMIQRILKENDLPPNLAYLAVVESNLNPNARSRANAVGLWQFMGATGKHFGLKRSWWHDDRYDPEKSTEAAAKFLKQLHKRFGGNWELALAAYNSGGGTVRRAVRKAKKKRKPTDFWHLKLPRETRGYVPAFYAVATIFKDLGKYGFKPASAWIEETPKQVLTVAGGISLKQIANVLSINYSILTDLNPSLRFRGLTPPTYDNFKIAVPGQIHLTQLHTGELEKLRKNRHNSWKLHRIRQGDTLWSISRSYKIPIRKILAYNRLRRKNLLRIGQKLLLPVPSDWSPPKVKSKTELTKSALDKLPGITHVHVVKQGDTLWDISRKYNIPIRTIKRWNRRILRRRILKIGTELILKLPLEIASKSIQPS